ncbi:MAG: hypothetical protein C4321_03855 [Chloroflexota bacterium]
MLGRQGVAVLTIRDNESPSLLEFYASGGETYERDGYVTVTIARHFGGQGPVSVDYATQDETAQAGRDYQPTSGTVTFLEGEDFKEIRIHLLGDRMIEPTEYFALRLSHPQGNAVLGKGSIFYMALRDDDAVGTAGLNFVDPVPEDHSYADIVVSRTDGASRRVTVDYAVAGGTATPGEDYTPVSGTLVMEPGEIWTSFRVPIKRDALLEPHETIIFTLKNPTNGLQLGKQRSTVLTIVDASTYGYVEFANAGFTVDESGPVALVQVRRKTAPLGGYYPRVSYYTGDITFTVATARGTGLRPASPGATAHRCAFRFGGRRILEDDSHPHPGRHADREERELHRWPGLARRRGANPGGANGPRFH